MLLVSFSTSNVFVSNSTQAWKYILHSTVYRSLIKWYWNLSQYIPCYFFCILRPKSHSIDFPFLINDCSSLTRYLLSAVPYSIISPRCIKSIFVSYTFPYMKLLSFRSSCVISSDLCELISVLAVQIMIDVIMKK